MSNTPRTDDHQAECPQSGGRSCSLGRNADWLARERLRELIEMGMERTRLIAAVNDAIRRPLGVVPASAEEFYHQ